MLIYATVIDFIEFLIDSRQSELNDNKQLQLLFQCYPLHCPLDWSLIRKINVNFNTTFAITFMHA